MKHLRPTILLAATALLAPVFAQSPATPAAGGAAPAPASGLPPEVQAALDRARNALATQPAGGRGIAQPAMPNLLATARNTGDLTVGLVNMTENRSSMGVGQINLSLTVSGGSLPAGASVRRTTITSAVDDKDRNLVSNNARGGLAGGTMAFATIMNTNMRLMQAATMAARGGAMPAQGLTGNVTLAASRRDAVSIKVIEGELELFAPAAENGSVLVIKNVLAQMGKPLDHPALNQHGIEIIPVNQESYGVVRERLLNPAAVAAGVIQPDPTFANGPGLYVRDPAGKVAAYVLQSASGAVLPGGNAGTRSAPDGGFLNELRLTGPAPADAQLMIYLAVPEATKVVPFRFENVALP